MQVNDQALAAGCRLFRATGARSLGGFEAALYEVTIHGVRHMLRFTPVAAGGLARFRARWEFVDYLARSGVAVSAPVESINGSPIETLDESAPSRTWGVVCVRWISGENLDPRRLSRTSAAVLRAWGALMGRMHSVARRFGDDERFPDWREEATSFLEGSSDPAIRTRWQQMIRSLEELPTDRACYGLVHNDLHYANILVDGSRVHAVDFDVCAYHWFISDIAVAMQAALWTEPSATVTDTAAWSRVFGEFMTGYRRENDLSDEWVQRLPTFLEYRRLLLYSVFVCEWAAPASWQRARLAAWRRGIVDGVPVVSGGAGGVL